MYCLYCVWEGYKCSFISHDGGSCPFSIRRDGLALHLSWGLCFCIARGLGDVVVMVRKER